MRRNLLIAWVIAIGAGFASAPRAAQAATIQAEVNYTGSLGPVSSRRPLCLCVYLDADLTRSAGCYISSANNVTFSVGVFSDTDYFLIAFVDLQVNERVDPNEPYEIYNDQARPPADPITAGSQPTTITITFGDENLPLDPTPSPTSSPTTRPTPTATATPVESPIGGPCAGDCDNSEQVVINEIITLVNIALGTLRVDACGIGDTSRNNGIEVNEIVAAVNSALLGCIR